MKKGSPASPKFAVLLPLSITGAERVHRVSTPVVPWPLCPDRREDGEEQWCGHDPALHLSPKHGSLVLSITTRHRLLQVAIGNAQTAVLQGLLLCQR